MTSPTESIHPPLEGRVILVTGAGSGLGRACALEAASRGATVVLLGRTVGKLEKVYDEILAAGGAMPAILPMDLELAEDRDFDSLAQAIASQLRRLDGIVHCAAKFDQLSPLALQTVGEWQQLYRVNCIAPSAIDRACEPLLKAAADASVVLVGATPGQQPAAYWGGFAAAKAGLAAYFRVQAEEWEKPPRPRINLFIPGPIDSPQRARSHPGESKAGLPSLASVAQAIIALLGPGDTRRGEVIEGSIPARDKGMAPAFERPQGRATPSPPPEGDKKTRGGPSFS